MDRLHVLLEPFLRRRHVALAAIRAAPVARRSLRLASLLTIRLASLLTIRLASLLTIRLATLLTIRLDAILLLTILLATARLRASLRACLRLLQVAPGSPDCCWSRGGEHRLTDELHSALARHREHGHQHPAPLLLPGLLLGDLLQRMDLGGRGHHGLEEVALGEDVDREREEAERRHLAAEASPQLEREERVSLLLVGRHHVRLNADLFLKVLAHLLAAHVEEDSEEDE